MENAREEQREAFDEAINAHASMGKAVMETTAKHCGELQEELMELRSETQKELSALHGVLEVLSIFFCCVYPALIYCA